MDAVERHLEVFLHHLCNGRSGLYAQIYPYELLDNPPNPDSGRLRCIYPAVQNNKDRGI